MFDFRFDADYFRVASNAIQANQPIPVPEGGWASAQSRTLASAVLLFAAANVPMPRPLVDHFNAASDERKIEIANGYLSDLTATVILQLIFGGQLARGTYEADCESVLTGGATLSGFQDLDCILTGGTKKGREIHAQELLRKTKLGHFN